MVIQWGLPAGPWQTSTAKPCAAGKSVNFYAAGMTASTTHRLRHVVISGTGQITASPELMFTTGVLTVSLPGVLPLMQPGANTSWQEGILLHAPLHESPAVSMPFATNLAGQLVWYYDAFAQTDNVFPYVTRPVPGGTMLIMDACCLTDNFLLEIDLAGNTIRQTTRSRLNEQLLALGKPWINMFHHDAIRLPNGYTALLGGTVRVGEEGEPSYMGDMVMVLDRSFQLVWVWDPFDHLSTARGPVLGETCESGYGPLCAPGRQEALDWMHTNSISYQPQDGSLILSMRHQDWVIKIDFGNGTGSGAILWRLGKDGDFTTNSTDPYPWFSHQHDARWISPNRIVLYDNGNTRCKGVTGTCNSRGQVWEIDEVNRTAQLILNADLLRYSDRYGSAQALGNGNYSFGSGFLTPELVSITIEVGPNGSVVNNTAFLGLMYRSFRLSSLYR